MIWKNLKSVSSLDAIFGGTRTTAVIIGFLGSQTSETAPLENEKHKDNLVMSSKKDMAVKVCRILTMAHETTKECTLAW